MRKCYPNVSMLLRKFVKCSPDVKCYLFKTYCCNLYCAPFLYDSTKAVMKNLKHASEMFVNLNIPSFDELLRKFVYSFKSRIQNSCNSLVNGIVKSSVPLFSKIWVWCSDILNT